MDRPGFGLRRLTGLLLVLNLGVLVGGLGVRFWPVPPEATLEFNADKVRLLVAAETAPSPRHGAPDPSPAVVSASGAPNCLSWPSLDADKLAALEGHLKALGLKPQNYELRLAQRLGWWVFLPPLGNQEGVRAAMDEARRLGVTDMAAVRDGPLVNALSLGAFADVEKARVHAAVLMEKGLRGVRFGPRPGAGEVRLLLSGPLPAGDSASPEASWPAGLQPGKCTAE